MTLIHINLIITAMLVGLIWVIQVVHYPAFKFVDPQHFTLSSKVHMFRITLIVGPLMIIEILAASLLLLDNFSDLAIINLGLLALIWIVTAFFSVPCHLDLHKCKNLEVINKLVLTNWMRTILWSAKLLVAIKLIGIQ